MCSISGLCERLWALSYNARPTSDRVQALAEKFKRGDGQLAYDNELI